jgi:hypothetical protein
MQTWRRRAAICTPGPTRRAGSSWTRGFFGDAHQRRLQHAQLQQELATQESVTNPDLRKIAELKAELESRGKKP